MHCMWIQRAIDWCHGERVSLMSRPYSKAVSRRLEYIDHLEDRLYGAIARRQTECI